MPTPDELVKNFEERAAEKVAEEEAQREEREKGLAQLAEQREQQARDMAMRVVGASRQLISAGMIEAVGYRVIVLPIEAQKTLEAAEAEQFEHLASEGFEVKSEDQRKREERGENHGIVVSIGPVAFEGRGGREAWCDQGDTVVFARYAGTRVEHPPGSGTFYQVMNDEDIFARIK